MPRWPIRTVQERFWLKVTKQKGCWPWLGYKIPTGYGTMQIKIRHWEYAHRLAWRFTFGPIERGFHILHKCDNPGCVNPYHLRIGTHQDNMADKKAKGRGRKNGTTRHENTARKDAVEGRGPKEPQTRRKVIRRCGRNQRGKQTLRFDVPAMVSDRLIYTNQEPENGMVGERHGS